VDGSVHPCGQKSKVGHISASLSALTCSHLSNSIGRTELELAQLTSIRSYSFRPAFIVPLALPPPEFRSRYNTPFFQSVGKIIGSFSSSGAVGADVLAKGMIRSCHEGGSGAGIPGWPGKGKEGNQGVFENAEIRKLGEGLSA